MEDRRVWKSLQINKRLHNEFELNEKTALLVVLHFAAKVDGIESVEEIDLLQQIVSKSPLFEENSYKQDRKLISQVKQYCLEHDDSILDKAIGFLSPNLQKVAIFMAIEMVFVDGVLKDSEKEFIEQLAKKVNLDLNQVKCAIEVFSTIYMH